VSTEALFRGITNREMKDEIRKLLKEGWEVSITGRNHIKCTAPNGYSVFTGLTTSDRQAFKKFVNQCRKTAAQSPRPDRPEAPS
jgi:hypothetical protein